MSLISFLKSKVFLKNTAYVIGAFLLVVLLTTLYLRIYTHHGKSYRVPDLKGLSTEQVRREIKKNKLRFEIIDSLYVPETVPGTVLGQHPKAGSKVKQNRLVFLTISSLTPEKVRVPDLTDISQREAINRLTAAGLKLGKTEYRSSEFFNLVLFQTLNGRKIPKNTFVNKGTAIDLVVGRGLSNEKTVVPDLTGRNHAEAEQILEGIGLSIGALVYDQTVVTAADSSEAIIWRQRPENSSTEAIEIGSSIDVWLTTPSIGVEMEPETFEE